MIQMPLTCGRFALIDDCDFDVICAYTWRSRHQKHTKSAYAVRTTHDGSSQLMHRVILGLTDKNVFVDHINRDGLDNRRANLRIATRSQNGANRTINATNKTGFRGVTWLAKSKRFTAQISQAGMPTYLGSFITAEEAHAAYVAKGRELFGDFFDL